MTAYYNENDQKAAAWLKELIARELIAPGEVDERSIENVEAKDLEEFEQHHFFAGIGGWSYALRLAGWPDNQPVWTGSCPCQPLSSAGQRKGHADKRHLWPAFYRLIAECKPSVVFGEQVASKDGREWLAGVRADLEVLGYACGAADLCVAGVGAPHIRQRLYWVADAGHKQSRRSTVTGQTQSQQPFRNIAGHSDDVERMDFSGSGGWRRREGSEERNGDGPETRRQESERGSIGSIPHSFEGLANADCASEYGGASGGEQSLRDAHDECVDGMGYAEGTGLQKQWRLYRPSGERHRGLVGFAIEAGVPQWNGPTVAVECSDGWRRLSAEPNAFPLAHGVSSRMGKLRGAGNAIVPQVAQAFIEAWIKTK